MTTAAPVEQLERASAAHIALLGNPNTGKTTLFNRLCGLRQKTSNFPGTTQEARIGAARLGAGQAALIDLPGVYSLELKQPEARVCREVLAGETAPTGERVEAPDTVCVVCDATNLGRNLIFLGEVLRRRLPAVVVLNMNDLAERQGIAINRRLLEAELGCPVVRCSARRGDGVADVARALDAPRIPTQTPPGDERGLEAWAQELFARAASAGEPANDEGHTDRVDRALTHPVLGVVIFAAVMTALFAVIFKLAEYPMGWIEWIFGAVGGLVEAVVPPGILQDLLVGGVVNGLGATVIFIPQIVLLFFLISLLEDTGYLARATLLMDRVLRPFGLPGHAFVPLLSAHACAIPGIMACRCIPDRRERLATILVAPFMSCTARIPVYVLLVSILFTGKPVLQALAFTGCYALGLLAGLFTSAVFRRSVLRGRARPMAIELPSYKWPSLSTASLTSVMRGVDFLKKAGTAILAICIVLWWLDAFPRTQVPPAAVELRRGAQVIADDARADEMLVEAARIERSEARAGTLLGRIGRAVEPVFTPMGCDWRLSIGVLSSLAAREVFVSTMAVIISGEELEGEGLRQRIASAERDDGSLIFTRPTSWALLVYYVLAMQCLPTLAVTAREAGGRRWALLQLVWMTGLGYLAATAVYTILG